LIRLTPITPRAAEQAIAGRLNAAIAKSSVPRAISPVIERRKSDTAKAWGNKNVSMDGVIHALYVAAKFDRAEREIRSGKGIPDEDAQQRMKKWQR